MAIGPGKYDALCTQVRETTQAEAVVVIVLNGRDGSGFSMQSLGIDRTRQLPDLLERMAAEIRGDLPDLV